MDAQIILNATAMRNYLTRALDTIRCYSWFNQPIRYAMSKCITFPQTDWRLWNAIFHKKLMEYFCMLSSALWSHCFLVHFAEYDSDTSCHYKMELSYENFITSGPDPHPPPIADDESDDDDDDDIPRVRNMASSACCNLWSKYRSCNSDF